MRVPSVRRFFCGVSFAGEVLAGNALVSGFSAGVESLAFSVLSTRLAGTFIPAFEVAFEAGADSLEGKAAVSGAFVVALAVALVVRLTAFAVVFLTALVAFTAVFVALAALAVVLAGAFVAFGFAESVAAALVFAVVGLAVAVVVGLPSASSVFCAAASFGLSVGVFALAVVCAFFTPALTT